MKRRYRSLIKCTIATLILCMGAGLSAQAQTEESLRLNSEQQLLGLASGNVSFAKEGMPLKEALNMLEQQFSISFVYAKGVVQHKKVKRDIRVGPNLEEVLKAMLTGHSVKYVAMNPKTYGLFSTVIEELAETQPMLAPVTGTVTDANSGETLPGVNVIVKGTNRGTSTDSEGSYELDVPSLQDTLIFSFIGYQTKEVPIEGNSEVNIELTPQSIQGEEMIVTGYRTQERGSVTGSVSSVNASELQDISADNLSNALSGRLSGVTVTQGGGTPGISSDIRIRAIGTFNNADPLYVIDGVVKDKDAFDALSQNEVESISILKDGAAASIYGSRAANGVVLLTTKRGSTNQAPTLSYSGNYGIQTPTRIPESLNAYEHATLINDALDYIEAPSNDARYYTQDELDYFQENSWNWVDEMWRDPISTQHSLDVSGGSDNIRYFLGGSYLYSVGSFDNLDFHKLNLRGNVDVNVTENLTASLDLSTNSRTAEQPSWSTGDWEKEDLYKALVLRSNMIPPYVNGEPTGNWVEWHPGAIIDRSTGYNDRKWTGLDAALMLDYEVPFVEGLGVNLKYNRYRLDEYRKQFNLPYNMTVFNTLGENDHIVGDQPVGIRPRSASEFLANEYTEQYSYQFNAQVNFQRDFGNHHLDLLGVYEQTEEDRLWFQGRRDNFVSPAIDQFIAGGSAIEDQRANGAESQSARVSYVGVASYDYNQTYLLEASFRYDGSVVFAPEHRWGFFPSGSFGWRVSNESFFTSDFFNELMVRGSVGLLGNDEVGSFQWLQSYNLSGGAIFDAQSAGLEPGSLVNRGITWEKSLSYNFGLDTRFWDDRMDLKLDLFYRNTYDILGSRQTSIPSTFGASLPDENYQEVHTQGFEVELGYNSSFSDASPFRYRVRGNFGYATNEIINLDEAENIRPYQSRIGRTTGGHFALVATDIIRTQEDLDALPDGYTIYGDEPRLGMLNYRDIRGPNSDEPDGRITSDDQQYISNYNEPPINYGLSLGGSWKSLRVDILLQGVAGHDVMLHSNARRVQGRAEEASYRFWSDHWTPDNPDAAYPAARRVGWPPTDYRASTWFVRDGSFLRLKNLNISYNLPQRITNSLSMNNIRLFFSGSNLLLLYDNMGDWDYDPEVSNIRAYPMMKTYSFGLNVNL